MSTSVKKTTSRSSKRRKAAIKNSKKEALPKFVKNLARLPLSKRVFNLFKVYPNKLASFQELARKKVASTFSSIWN